MILFALLGVIVSAVGAGLVLVNGARRSSVSPRPATAASSSVSRELTKLDPFSFFVLSGRDYGIEHVVVGTTGAYAVSVSDATVEGNYRRDVARANRAARMVRHGAGQTAVHTKIQPLVCLTGHPFSSKSVRGAKVIPWGAVVTEIAGRNRSVTPNQARRIAEALGAVPAKKPAHEHEHV
jgi:hypothetical protein